MAKKKTKYRRVSYGMPISPKRFGLFVIVLLAIILPLTLMVAWKQVVLSQNAEGNNASPCQFQKADQPLTVAFCDTFDQPMGTGNRSGDLDGTVWGVSRIISSDGGNYPSGTNPSQGYINNFAPVAIQKCGTNPSVYPDNDVAICNGQLIEAVNDDGGQTVLAMYPKQPFDIAGRTGTVVFDVGADSEGPHAAWPTFVYTDQPIPAPYSQASGIETSARNSIGFTLASDCGQWGCGGNNNNYPNYGQPSFDQTCTTVDSMFMTTNYQLSQIPFNVMSCVLKPTQAGQLNHFEVRISQNQIQVWATDAGGSTLKEIAEADNISVPLTRGLIWIEDTHYNANKYNDQQSHTFIWDNVGFDGPILPRDLATDVPENKTMDNDSRYPGKPAMQLGWIAPSSGTPLSLTVPNIQNLSQAAAAIITMNWMPTSQDTINYQVNGNTWHTQPWVMNTDTYSWRTIALPVPLSEIQNGDNVVHLMTSDDAAVANVDLILVGAGGIPTCIDPSNCSGSPVTTNPTVGPTFTPTPTLQGNTGGVGKTPTNTPTPTFTPTPTPRPTSTPTPTMTPMPVAGSGFIGNYFNNISLSGAPILTRIDPTINFNWGYGSPASVVNTDNFSARWTGYVTPPTTGMYKFYIGSDDGARVWVNNTEIINKWFDHSPTTFSGNISLTAGQEYPIRVEYYEHYGQAVARLYWSGPSLPTQIVPSSVVTH